MLVEYSFLRYNFLFVRLFLSIYGYIIVYHFILTYHAGISSQIYYSTYYTSSYLVVFENLMQHTKHIRKNDKRSKTSVAIFRLCASSNILLHRSLSIVAYGSISS